MPYGRTVRILQVTGTVLGLLLGAVITVVGLAALGTTNAPFPVGFGLVLLAGAVGGGVREVSLVRFRRHPPLPRLASLDATRALHLPRARGASLVPMLTLTGIGVGLAAAALASYAADEGAAAGVLLLLAAGFVVLGAPYRIEPGGVWLTPEGISHEQDGVSWQVAWTDVTGSLAEQPVPVLVRERPPIHRAPGALWHGRLRRDRRALWIDARFLAGGPTLVSYAIMQALADPRFRAVLGTPESLPPAAR